MQGNSPCDQSENNHEVREKEEDRFSISPEDLSISTDSLDERRSTKPRAYSISRPR